MYSGIDISAVQGSNVDMNWVKQKGFSFVVNRSFVGNDYKDSVCDTNVAKEKDAGLLPAIYNFVYPLSASSAHPNRDPIGQANLHYTHSNNELAAVDAEWPAPQDFAQWGCSPSQIRDWLLQYLERYTQLSGKKPLLYTYPYWAKAVGFTADFAQYPLWIASYTATPSIPAPWSDYYMWQTSGGDLLTLPNVGKCDTDTVKDLSWWGVVEQAPVVEPAPIQITTPTPEAVVTPAAPTPTVAMVPAATNTTLQTILNVVIQIIKALFHIP